MTKSKKYLLAVVFLFLLVIVLSIFIPKKFHINTEFRIDVPSNMVYNVLNNLSHQPDFNNKSLLDSSFHLICLGASKDDGASCDYSSKRYGNGVFRIIKAINDDSIAIADESQDGKISLIQYKIKQLDTLNSIVIVVAESESGFFTNLWTFIHKWKLKKQVNKNLENLKTLLDDRFLNKNYNGYHISEVVMNQRFFVTYRAKVDFKNINEYFSKNISGLYQKALENKITIAGMPSALIYEDNKAQSYYDFAAALPTFSEFNILGLEPVTLPPHQAIFLEYKGEHSKSEKAYTALEEYLADFKLNKLIPTIEEYVTDPLSEPNPEKWVTNIIYYIDHQ
ncbi:MAG: GyrI-like domain-containing protein [Saprospiraceae bacterium]|jgi:effector-binding domain-containing protein|nr:GyrI-like domain-containing protein [Saprospiraceae bacterium]